MPSARSNTAATSSCRHFPIHKTFERSELGCGGLRRQISEASASASPASCTASSTPPSSRPNTPPHLEPIEARLRKHEKFATFLRNEVCSNNLADFGLRKGLEHLADVREKFLAVTARFATFQARCLNAHVDFPLLQRLALPITLGSGTYPGIKIHDTRIIRLLQVLLHAGTTVGGWRVPQLHEVIVTSFGLDAQRYRLNQLRYDLRKLRAHGLLQRR
jgi:hypothetical protein